MDFKRITAVIAGIGAVAIATINQTSAYIFTSTGMTVEEADVTNVSTSAMQGVGVTYESLKFLGIIIMVGAVGWVLNKIFSIKVG